jgi:membrane complex biogenesis BtpA family protein
VEVRRKAESGSVEILESIFGREKCLIGVVHLLPLAGSPLWGGDAGAVAEQALADAVAIENAGFDGIILENFGDAPFARDFAGRGAVAGLAAVGARVAERVALPLGVNVLRNDARSAVAVAAAIGGRFIRVNVHVGALVTDQGIIQGDAMATMKDIREMAPGLPVFADVFVKHAVPLGEGDIGRSARETVERGLASALIVTGDATGSPASMDDLSLVKDAVRGTPVLVGSGVTAESVRAILDVADGVIVGSAIMKGGRPARPIDPAEAVRFAEAAEMPRGRT